ncbi:hypothetical protein CKO25_11240 [Thiocapsa imhoffii]|uniref:SHOCT domain-containing protein n=1 Tax=Thiocapsa imhoffii TaxID=382777 RepID=A0A9X0WIN9_9GAMM|nr:hypothetical protein [Thiocapsa imhoffii]MBK1645205.1 hypothetical protein [Thiocapsa imhoffii]
MESSIWVWLILGAFLALAILKAFAERQAYAVAKAAYRDALEALAADPTNTTLRQAALQRGRDLAAAVQQDNDRHTKPRRPPLDEMAIRNDLDAIYTGVSSTPVSLANELTALATLHREGILSDAELARLKQRLTGAPSGVQDLIQLLRGLKALEREGVLSEGEFNLKKWDLLAKRLPLER